MRIAVAGGTGWLGKLVVAEAERAGHEVVVIARSRGVDLVSGNGLTDALRGVDVVVDVSNVQTLSGRKATEFFETVTRNLLNAERRAGVRHHVLVSIIGVDRVEWGYYQAKLHQEQIALNGPVPATVLRAAQFHEFAEQSLTRFGGPVAVVPAMLSQPVAAREVAVELVRLAEGEPAGLAPEIAGPEPLQMADLVRRVARTRGPRKWVLTATMPGKAGRAMATGGNLPATPGLRGTQTFDQWLTESRA
ncbi:3-beta hydroxysteroid dehydrogenase [Actinoplanes sp. SE50]|uniref:SDR family oxidoreductase n=1 Tax=unclassified Actinoplanes TaxID=2626549 RepID=UPI00023EBB7F|nr:MULTISPECIES: NAD(P)H-binding protein [unclassified Actinoplanes]AEV83988.1 Prestalk A differentiation protein A [Actinoplanes sp. SE50/110]ATO82381.1 3-beta hydroxysteroid dehydrogenase [Actinoplanes sp. SE50]SLL99788.1 3-beta hydroxysteroid dehydrogenase [Actinoplanes sp. SE50/110]